jgi:hypothetical protein
MNKALSIVAAVAGLAIAPTAARADEIARTSNATAILSVLDAITTRANIANGSADERNPIARPFVRTNVGTALYFASAVASVNLFARILHRTSPAAARTFLVANAAFEAACVANNTRYLGR